MLCGRAGCPIQRLRGQVQLLDYLYQRWSSQILKRASSDNFQHVSHDCYILRMVYLLLQDARFRPTHQPTSSPPRPEYLRQSISSDRPTSPGRRLLHLVQHVTESPVRHRLSIFPRHLRQDLFQSRFAIRNRGRLDHQIPSETHRLRSVDFERILF